MKHIMIDCETFGLRPSCAIVSLGAVVFDPYIKSKLGATFHEGIDLKSSMNHGLNIDADTMLWWLAQPQLSREALIVKIKSASSLSTVLNAFTGFVGSAGGKEAKLWSCGSRDFEWLESAYTAVKQPVPWGYRTGDYRTIRDEFCLPEDYAPPGVSHDALSDAVFQAKTLQNIFARIKL